MEYGFSRGRGGNASRARGAPRGRRGLGNRRGRGMGRRQENKEWVPVTKLGKLVKAGKITDISELFFYSMPIKEPEIIDKIFGPDVLKDELLSVSPVQKQTSAGQRTRFKAVSVVGDCSSFIGIGIKCAKEASTAIRGAITVAKLSLVSVRKGYWGTRYGDPHTVPEKITGKCGSVTVRLIPAPKGTGIVAASTPRAVLHLAGFKDVYTQSSGKTRTKENFAKATVEACAKTYGYLTPDLWKDYSDSLGELPLVRYSAELTGEDEAKQEVAE